MKKVRYHLYIKNDKYYICDDKRKTCFEIVEKDDSITLVEKKDVYKSFKKNVEEFKNIEKEMKELVNSLNKLQEAIESLFE